MTSAQHYRGRSPQTCGASSVHRYLKRSFRETFAWRRRPATGNRFSSTTFIVKARRLTSDSQRRLSPVARNALGRGLGALIREPDPHPPVVVEPTSVSPV